MNVAEKILLTITIGLLVYFFNKPPKIWNDTLRPKGRYEVKRVMAFSSFFFGSFYAFVPIFYPAFDVKDFVVWAFFSLAGGSTFIAMREKFLNSSSDLPTNKDEQL